MLASIVVGIAAPSAAAGEAPPNEGPQTELRIGTATRPDSLNPLVASNRLGRILTSLLYDELRPVDANGEPLPGLIIDWKPSGDGRLWLLELRPGLRWSDGEPVNARDVIHTLRRIKNDPRSRFSRWLDNVTLIKRFNDRRVGVRLATPSQTPPVLPIPLLPRHIWSSVQPRDVTAFANDPPIGSGTFAATTPSEDNSLRLSAPESHWRGQATVDELTVQFYESQAALVEALEAGDVDVADDLGPEQAQFLDARPNIEIRPTPATAFVSLGMNTGSTDGDGHIALREPRVRRAIAFALDREELRELALGSYGLAGSTIVPPALEQHVAPPPGNLITVDLDRAQELLARARLLDADEDGVLEDNLGLPFQLRLYTRRSLPETRRVGERIVTALRAVGIDVLMSELTDRELSQRIRGGRYDLFIWGWDVGSDPSFIASVLSCSEALPSGLSDTYFCDGKYDDLYNRYVEATGAGERQTLLAELQMRAYTRAPYVVLYYRPTFQAFRADRFELSSDESLPIVFAPPPERPINLEPRRRVTEATQEDAATSAPTTDLVDEIRSSRLWQIVALVGLVIVILLVLPRLIRGALWLARLRKRASDGGDDAEAESAENDGGRP